MKSKNNISVIMIRHAQSEWNRENRFTGWANPVLTDRGRHEAINAASILNESGYRFDQVYTSRLIRAQETADIILNKMGQIDIPVQSDWRLNERHYGRLQGLDKTKMTEQVGEKQVWRWRRSFMERPPALPVNAPEHPMNCSYWDDVPRERVPNGENLAMTRIRVTEFWNEVIKPQVENQQRILISSHGNTLRALLMALDDMSIEEVESFEIPTGQPIEYVFNGKGKPIGWHYLKSTQKKVA